jgi:hypothetical protein
LNTDAYKVYLLCVVLHQEGNTLSYEQLLAIHEGRAGMWVKPTFQRKTKIVCTIGPTSNTREMIWKLAAEGMNVARLNMSHGDHASHKKVVDLVREYNKEANSNVIAIMLDTKVCVPYLVASKLGTAIEKCIEI